MTRRMSCSMTIAAVKARTKTVTRRHVDTWCDLKPGDRLTLIEKGMGLPKGGHQVVLAEVEVTAVDVVPLWPIGWAELQREGLWDEARAVLDNLESDQTPSGWFCHLWLASHGYHVDHKPEAVTVRRIEWRYL